MKKRKNKNLGKKFKIYVKIYDEFKVLDELNSGFICGGENIHLELFPRNGIVFEEKENGHGSYEDWRKFFTKEHSDWVIENEPYYIKE